MSGEILPLVSLIKCLYNTNSAINPLYISDTCYYAYKERYGEELELYNYKNGYTTNPKLITLVEDLGLEECNGTYTDLAIQHVPEALQDYIEVIFDKGIKIVSINYDKAFANILHTQKLIYEDYTYSYSTQLLDIYRKYYRIAHIKEKVDERTISHTQTQNDDKVYDKKIFTIKE